MSREVDALVAEHVFGHVVTYMSEQDVIPVVIIDQATANYDELPEYSTDIAAAWKVWERLRDGRGYCCMSISSPTFEGYEVSLTKLTDLWHRPTVVGGQESAPMVICLAALKALGVEVPNES